MSVPVEVQSLELGHPLQSGQAGVGQVHIGLGGVEINQDQPRQIRQSFEVSKTGVGDRCVNEDEIFQTVECRERSQVAIGKLILCGRPLASCWRR